MQINCFEPDLDKADLSFLEKCLNSKNLGFGPNVEKFETQFAKFSKQNSSYWDAKNTSCQHKSERIS